MNIFYIAQYWCVSMWYGHCITTGSVRVRSKEDKFGTQDPLPT